MSDSVRVDPAEDDIRKGRRLEAEKNPFGIGVVKLQCDHGVIVVPVEFQILGQILTALILFCRLNRLCCRQNRK
ncbi:hypothetical protein BpHYR1_027221 [Brachionus plicatilis]|uniref:Uncharacterized protein n=1 Tax=Brachionus plicatilis TaxID=10195 RepID=A0A3M7T8B9_BRAPC|nr:hypothetical protein BpHYR1_027221 [Brachionus plicatilis]